MGQKRFLEDFLGVKWPKKDFWRISWVRNGSKKFFGGFLGCEMAQKSFLEDFAGVKCTTTDFLEDWLGGKWAKLKSAAVNAI
jgi:hypothetical protein